MMEVREEFGILIFSLIISTACIIPLIFSHSLAISVYAISFVLRTVKDVVNLGFIGTVYFKNSL